jgi:hypothetical protein
MGTQFWEWLIGLLVVGGVPLILLFARWLHKMRDDLDSVLSRMDAQAAMNQRLEARQGEFETALKQIPVMALQVKEMWEDWRVVRHAVVQMPTERE